MLPGSALKVCVVAVGWWVLKANLVIIKDATRMCYGYFKETIKLLGYVPRFLTLIRMGSEYKGKGVGAENAPNFF
jgi:hypothetical protein